MADMLAAMGMPQAFGDGADFSAMTAEEQLFISAVAHQAFIAVDEQGTEAAAATAVVMEPTSAEAEPPPVVNVDRPFLYAIRDLPTSTVLFLGRVLDPTRGE
jgi:serpin B